MLELLHTEFSIGKDCILNKYYIMHTLTVCFLVIGLNCMTGKVLGVLVFELE